jgi:hypothetical protein
MLSPALAMDCLLKISAGGLAPTDKEKTGASSSAALPHEELR